MRSALALRRAEWLRAMRWRRAVRATLRRVGLTFTQWQVLDALATLIRATEDAVSHSDVAVHLELDRATVGGVMAVLERRGLVSHGDAYMSNAWRVILTQRGRALLETQRAALEVESVRVD
ncbi:MAG: MarR family transcriptional regulator [Polyangiaceae bacterium]